MHSVKRPEPSILRFIFESKVYKVLHQMDVPVMLMKGYKMKWITAKGRGQQYTKFGIRDMRTELLKFQSYFM